MCLGLFCVCLFVFLFFPKLPLLHFSVDSPIPWHVSTLYFQIPSSHPHFENQEKESCCRIKCGVNMWPALNTSQ